MQYTLLNTQTHRSHSIRSTISLMAGIWICIQNKRILLHCLHSSEANDSIRIPQWICMSSPFSIKQPTYTRIRSWEKNNLRVYLDNTQHHLISDADVSQSETTHRELNGCIRQLCYFAFCTWRMLRSHISNFICTRRLRWTFYHNFFLLHISMHINLVLENEKKNSRLREGKKINKSEFPQWIKFTQPIFASEFITVTECNMLLLITKTQSALKMCKVHFLLRCHANLMVFSVCFW